MYQMSEAQANTLIEEWYEQGRQGNGYISHSVLIRMVERHHGIMPPVCPRCSGPMRQGIALIGPMKSISTGTDSPGHVVPCMKCSDCGVSIT